MKIDKQKLKALALAATESKWTTDDLNEVMSAESDQLNSGFIIADCQGPDRWRNAQYIAAACPATILALLAEIDELAFEPAKHSRRLIDQLKAESEALRELKLPHYLKLSDEMRAAGEHAEQRAREDQCYSVPVLKAVFFEAAIQRWLDDQEEAIDAAMAKGAT